ncbi:MAG TPA: 2-oxo acid dehydrogenase subunit E2, partial [Propionibacteriaceae bacterium]|nr:2-oxo acid dehydrogenase subunit E2 [Propionibacteriaceae bacterium]
MAIVPDQSPTSAPAEADFGANDWLLEEMYEQYTVDPNSVDQTWAEYFKVHGAPTTDAGNGAASEAPQPQPQQAPEPRADSGDSAGPKGTTAAAPAAPAQTPPAAQPQAQPAPRRTPTVEKPSPTKEVRPSAPGTRGGVPADPPSPADRPNVAIEQPVKTTMRGAPARTAKNMEISLAVPTATSVRSLPVKLLIDQRVVINNHLRRARGGKVSYTHIIGYAMVQALKSMPAMNNAYDVLDGKPTMIVPAHVNLGLAIDMPKQDGTRQLLVPSIKSCETLDFAQFWNAYEQVVKKARAGQLTLEDFAGTTITL